MDILLQDERLIAGGAVVNAVLREVPAFILSDLSGPAEFDRLVELALHDGTSAWIGKTDDAISRLAAGETLRALISNPVS